jgi:serine/threonine-protein kinase RIO1
MIYPSIGELTNNYQINRYTLVVATAKCARIITEEYTKQREYAEKLVASDIYSFAEMPCALYASLA